MYHISVRFRGWHVYGEILTFLILGMFHVILDRRSNVTLRVSFQKGCEKTYSWSLISSGSTLACILIIDQQVIYHDFLFSRDNSIRLFPLLNLIIRKMHFVIHQHIGAFALLACFSASVLASPVANPIEIPTGQWDANILFEYWAETNFGPDSSNHQEIELNYNWGNCENMLSPNLAKSAKAPKDMKCTIYSEQGCHGWRTREFTIDGIADMGPKMNGNGEAWRCCKIGTTNGWGYCDAKLHDGTRWTGWGSRDVNTHDHLDRRCRCLQMVLLRLGTLPELLSFPLLSSTPMASEIPEIFHAHWHIIKTWFWIARSHTSFNTYSYISKYTLKWYKNWRDCPSTSSPSWARDLHGSTNTSQAHCKSVDVTTQSSYAPYAYTETIWI